MGGVIENLITLALWIVASYYLRSRRKKAEPKPKEQGQSPLPAKSRRAERDPLEESVRRRPRFPSSLDDLDESQLQVWETRLLRFAEESGMIEDEDGWEVPWSGYRYYDFDELFELYVHREGKPLVPPATLVLVEGPSGEQVPVLVPNESAEEEKIEAEAVARAPLPIESEVEPSIKEDSAASSVPEIRMPEYLRPLATSEEKNKATATDHYQARRHSKVSDENRQALVAGLILSELGVFRRRQRSRL